MTAAAPARLPRHDLDYYGTPPELVHAILPHLPHARTVLDPCCGVGEILAEVGAVDTLGIEMDPARAEQAMDAGVHGVTRGDALLVEWPHADACLFNPPFSHALAFALRAVAWRSEDPRRTVAMLARLTFLESAERAGLHREHPSDVYVFSRRPRFRSDTRGTDSVTCMWMVWGPDRGGRWWVL